jgi:uncharacterized protein
VAELALGGTAALECQRCMQEMEVRIDTSARVALIPSDADANRVPEDLEPMLAPGGRTSVREIVEEELMLFLPIVPLHGDSAAGSQTCAASSPGPEAAAGSPDPTHRPFERLQELLKRK